MRRPWQRGLHFEVAREADHRPDQRRVPAVGIGRTSDEGLVDLDLVEWNTEQITEARIARSEVVQRKLYADRLQLVDDRMDVIVIAQQQTLGDLQLEARRREAAFAEDRPNGRGQRVGLELDR